MSHARNPPVAATRDTQYSCDVSAISGRREPHTKGRVPRTAFSFPKAISKYLLYYNGDRMHMGTGFKTPAQMLQMLPRP
jgi:hypothetical protein